jgi:hypothetical protein
MTQATFPLWLDGLSTTSLVVALVCSAWIVADEVRRPQHMWIMNLVWPLTALFGGVLWLAGYLRWCRSPVRRIQDQGAARNETVDQPRTPMAVAVAKGASHCGAGCALGDLLAEWAAFTVPGFALALGWKTIFADKIFADWVLDYLLAFAIGLAFQYFTIKPMRDLRVKDALLQALKADAASIASWQVGMYGFMAFAQFFWFAKVFGGAAPVASPEFWFAMQMAMLCGFATSYPVNWLLVRAGVKERM